MSVRFWGVRGSIAVPGQKTQMFGGNTACIEVLVAGRRFIIDAGTGILPLSDNLDPNPARGEHFDVLFTHLHHDHVVGLMSFAPLFVEGATVNLYCGNLDGATAEAALRNLFSPPLFPLTFDDLPAKVRFIGFNAGEVLQFGGVAVSTCPLNHPGGATGYRFDSGGQSAVFLTDVEHASDRSDPMLVAFCQGAGLLVYDATWDVPDYPRFKGWGHSTWAVGADLASSAGVERLACFHHAPEYDDERLLEMERTLQDRFPNAFFAREAMTVTLDARAKLSALAGSAPGP
ncbi:MBL fold metallo-hydrolase [Flaviflagellibacter deserti]|uniref:MBL fold metallo-hydrolase n=1 Tax=Flaviflagellibacter deserti TaxID=2267266 RepID=A0ABV9YX70_9HYPH